jgi:hypothetical protein
VGVLYSGRCSAGIGEIKKNLAAGFEVLNVAIRGYNNLF